MIHHTKSHPCPVCGGCRTDPQGKGIRCWGFTSDDAAYVHCTRSELAGPLEMKEGPNTYAHRMNGSCKCGVEHGPATTSSQNGPVICYYEYRDEQDKPLFRVARRVGKQFHQERFENGEWIGGQGALDGIRRVIYRLPEILASEGMVLVVEGEKDADTGWALGFPSTTNPHGALHWKPLYNPFLKNRDVVIIPDADEKGQKHAQQVFDFLSGHAKSVRILELPGKDLTAWVEDGGSREELERLVSTPIDWRKILNAKPVQALELAPFIGKPIPYIVKPIVIRGSLTQIQGTQKGGKSAFANYLSLCASTGTWPTKHLKADTPVRVVYISWEDVKHMMAQKLALYGKGMNFETQAHCLPPNLTYIFRPFISIEQLAHLDAMKAMVKELEADILILDTLAHSHGCEENAASEMRLPMANLAALAEDMNIGVIYLHHIAKLSGDRSPQDKSRGSSAIAAAWHVLVDWGVREEDSNVNPVQIQSKFLHKFLRWEIEYSHNGSEEEDREPTWVKWNIEDMAPQITLAKKRENKLDQVWTVAQSLIPNHPTGISKQNLRVALDCSENTAGSYLEALCTQGRMMRSNSKPGGGRGNKITYKLPPENGSNGNLQNITLNE